MTRGSTQRKTTLPARLRAIAAVWLAFTIVSGAAPAPHADFRFGTPGPNISDSSADPTRVSLQRFEFHEPHMGTDTRVVLFAQDERAASAAVRAAFDRVEALNRMLSDYLPTSEL